MAAKKTRKKTTKKTKRHPKAPSTTLFGSDAETTEGGVPTIQQIAERPDELLASRDEAIRALCHSLNTDERRYIVTADEAPNPYMLRRPTGIMELDIDLGGGFPAGGMSIVSGPDNCLSGDTKIHHEVRRLDGTRVTHKWITLERLYQRFHGIKVPGEGKNQRRTLSSKTGIYMAPSMNDQGGIVQNRILDVVCTGDKECYEVTTRNGYKIIATGEHRFFNGDEFVTLSSLKAGDCVYIHDNTRKEAPSNKPTKKSRRRFFYVKHHGTAYQKSIRDKKTGKTYKYFVLPRSRACVEAVMNNLSLPTYIEHLNKGKVQGLKFLTSDQIVHHRDEDTTNDELSNLVVVTRAHHMIEHLKDKDRDNYFRFIATETRITSINPAGRRKTYDLKMAAPLNNYVANKFVVHNSGKTWLLLKVLAYQQRLYGQASRLAIGISEGAFPFDQAINAGLKIAVPDAILEQWQEWRRRRGIPLLTQEQLLFFKQKVGEVYIIRGDTGEDILKALLECARTRAFQVLGCDSLNGLQPEVDAAKELTDTEKMAAHAAMFGRFLKKYIPITTGLDGTNQTTVIFTQQVRANMERANMRSNIQKYIKPWATAGAWASRHYKLIDLHVWSGSTIKKDKGDGFGKRAVGKEFKWTTDKGKAGTHDNLSGEASYYYDLHGTDDIGELMTSGIKRGIIRKIGSKTVVVRPDTGEVLEDFTAPSQRALRKMLENDTDFEMSLRREILTAAGIQCLYL